MLDPFRHVGDYGQPRTTLLPIGNGRYVRRMLAISAGILAALLLGTYGVANASTARHPSARVQLHRLERAIVTGATFTLDHATYQAHRVAYPWTQEDSRLCYGFTDTFGHGPATLPELRELAYSATDASRWLRRDVASLLTWELSGRGYHAQYEQVALDCNPDA